LTPYTIATTTIAPQMLIQSSQSMGMKMKNPGGEDEFPVA
jgi:hypothetical protein